MDEEELRKHARKKSADAQANAFLPAVEAIKAAGAVAGIQIAHAGRKASANRPWEGDDHIPEGDPRGWQTIAPSAVPFGANLPRRPRAMTKDDIRRVQEAVKAETDIAVSVGGGTTKLVAKLAVSRAKPAGVHVVAPGAEGSVRSSTCAWDQPRARIRSSGSVIESVDLTRASTSSLQYRMKLRNPKPAAPSCSRTAPTPRTRSGC